MTQRLLRLPVNRWLEPVLALVIASGLAYAMWHLRVRGFLPQPFFYQPDDMWGDWFNVVYWAYDPGTYDSYASVYPPLTFVFLRVFSLSRCYVTSADAGDLGIGLAARSCDWVGIVTSHLIYVAAVVVAALTYARHDRKTAPWRAYALAAGFPMLEALDRNNLIILTFVLTALAYGPLVRSARLRWLLIGLSVNFKVYMIAAAVPQLLRRRWLWVEGAAIATVGVYLISFAILGRGTPAEIYRNITSFASGGAATFMDVWFPATYLALKALLENWMGPVMGLIGSRNVELSLAMIAVTTRATQVAIVLAAVGAWLRPETMSRYRLSNLGISLALITSESGGYSVVMIFFFTFFETWRGFGAKWAIIACYVLCIPFDIPLSPAPEVVRDVFWPNRTVITTYYVTLGPMVRPLILMSVPFALSCATLRAVWQDVRTRGWRGRRRFSRDAPLLLAGGRARREPVDG